MSEMVERVARRLYVHEMVRNSGDFGAARIEEGEVQPFEERGIGLQNQYRDLARVAITEMIRSTSQQRVVGIDFGPPRAAVAIAEIEVDICFEALPDFVLK